MGGISACTSAKFRVAVFKGCMLVLVGGRSGKLGVVVLKASMLEWGVHLPVHMP